MKPLLFAIFFIAAFHLISAELEERALATTLNSTYYQVSVQIRNTPTSAYYHRCGGTLISTKTVLTAANCFFQPSIAGEFNQIALANIRVVAGTTNLTVPDGTPAGQIRTAVNMTVHEDFSMQRPYENNVAVILLNGVITPTETQRPVVFRTDKLKKGLCVVSGFGQNSNLNEPLVTPRILQKAYISIKDSSDCKEKHGSLVSSNTICAGDVTENLGKPCPVDNGGPLVCAEELVGIMSFGDGCSLGVYTDVTSLTSWIMKNGSDSMKSSFVAVVLMAAILIFQ